MQRIFVRTKTPIHSYEIRIDRNVLAGLGEVARRWLGTRTRNIFVISNPTVSRLYGAEVIRSLRKSDFVVSGTNIGDGESYKSLTTLEKILGLLSRAKLERSDGILALGGGVVGDLAGFAAAVYLRGIPFIYAPTTLLAQIDSSVGGKTGVNLPTGKNLVGAFHSPSGVLTDTRTLQTLPQRELTSGYCEAVKQAAVANKKLFGQTVNFLERVSANRSALASTELTELLKAHCRFKASIVMKDEKEAVGRKDRYSRRILNFGHTTGHALEAVTSYRRFRHGEAVGVGILVAVELSKNMGLLSTHESERVTRAVGLCGRLPATNKLDENSILRSMGRDKKGLAGELQWVLLEGIGSPVIVSGKEISPRLLKTSLRQALTRAAMLRN